MVLFGYCTELLNSIEQGFANVSNLPMYSGASTAKVLSCQHYVMTVLLHMSSVSASQIHPNTALLNTQCNCNYQWRHSTLIQPHSTITCDLIDCQVCVGASSQKYHCHVWTCGIISCNWPGHMLSLWASPNQNSVKLQGAGFRNSAKVSFCKSAFCQKSQESEKIKFLSNGWTDFNKIFCVN